MARYIDTADVAKMVRAELKAAFPACTFAVKSKRYAGGSSISVRWTDGPTEARVREVAGHFHGQSFNGMDDSTSYHDTMHNGELVHFRNGYIFFTREMSDAHWNTVAATVAKYYGVAMPSRAESHNVRVPQAGEYFSTLVHRAVHDRARYTVEG